jgi:signal transduction histidine kinase/class 3 adenylate cyclase
VLTVTALGLIAAAASGAALRFRARTEAAEAARAELEGRLRALEGELSASSREVASAKAVAADVTGDRTYLERQCAELAERVSQLSVALKQQDDFYRHTSDELRLPVSAMVGIAEGLAEKSRAKYDRRFTHELQLVATTGKRLGAMLTNLIDFAALRTGTIVLEKRPIDLHSMVDVVTTMLSPAIGEKKLTVTNAIPADLPALLADEARVQQVMVNLLGNAVRYTTAGTVTVSASVEGDRIELLVHDTGPGLTTRALKSLIDPSVELSAEPDLEVRTSGLGVRVCKQLVELHGGEFLATSKLGEGSSFGFRLPWTSDAASKDIPPSLESDPNAVSSEPQARRSPVVYDDDPPPESGSTTEVFVGIPKPGPGVRFRLNPPGLPSLAEPGKLVPEPTITLAPARPTAPPSGGFVAAAPVALPEQPSPIPLSPRMPSSIRVGQRTGSSPAYRALVADDEAINLSLLGQQLESLGLQVTKAGDGAAAWETFEKEGPFDVVLLDVVMPKMNGYEVCRSIRTRFTAAAVPVLMLTGKHDAREYVQGFEAGANDFLTKPFAKKELTMRVRMHLGIAKTNEALGRFVPRHFLELLGRDAITDVQLGDQVERNLPVMFGDVRNFTSIAEAIGSAETFAFLNSLLSRIGPAIRAEGGFIDKYIGDAFMALFPSSVDAAIRAAIRIQRELDLFNEAGLAPLGRTVQLGMGLHAGPMRLGTIGEDERFEATVISDAVNLTSRLESLTKTFGVRAIVTENVVSGALETYDVRHLGAVKVRGKVHSVGVFDLVSADTEEQRELKLVTRARFEEGIHAFARADLEEAKSAFEQVAEVNPSDGAAWYYLGLLSSYDVDGVPSAFDGTLTFERK